MKTLRKRVALGALCVVAGLAFGAATAINPDLYLSDVKYLASPELRGRATGSKELEQAAAFLADKFREFGLKPLDGPSFFQAFPVTTEARLGESNRLRLSDDGHSTDLRVGDDYIPLNFSSSATLTGGVVFAGYGITAPEYHYDDYADVDVKGRIVLVLRHEPQEFDEHSIFAGKAYTLHSQFASKASNARMHGAAGVILVSDRANHPQDTDDLEKFGSTTGPSDAGIAFVQVKEERVDKWFRDAGKSLETIEAGIDKDLKPESFVFPASIRVNATLDLQREVKTVHNVTGYLAGETDEYVIIGAHYDHLGLGGQYSLAPSMTGTVHPGADDNASGTAGVIELARWYGAQPKQKRGILFLAFAGEELGLLGSSYYVAHPQLPLEKAVAMINMDMIGRIRNGKIYVGGAETGSTLRPMLERITPQFHLNADFADTAGEESSDHVSFITKQVPVLFFFSGLHADYHKPSDTWDKIDAPAAAKLLEMVAAVADDLRNSPARPEFIRVARKAPGTTSGGGGYGAYFGSIPDFGEGVKGVKFADVREASPAAKAGFKAGDILVEFDGKPIQNLYDFTYALQAHKPGDTVKVKVVRDGTPLEAAVTLAKRQ